MRHPLIAGNWKMNKTAKEAVSLVNSIKAGVHLMGDVTIVLCPPFIALPAVAPLLDGTTIELGAQDLFWEPEGAYTGEISPLMLKDCGCRYVIVGHSERRQHFRETDHDVNRKLKAALQFSLLPIVCVGETLAEREAGRTHQRLEEQLTGSFAQLSQDDWEKPAVAYEPVWAIGTGRTASPEQAQDAHAFIRSWVARNVGREAAGRLRILYGGSVTQANSASLLAEPDVDGALVGGASLKAESFIRIVESAAKRQVKVVRS